MVEEVLEGVLFDVEAGVQVRDHGQDGQAEYESAEGTATTRKRLRSRITTPGCSARRGETTKPGRRKPEARRCGPGSNRRIDRKDTGPLNDRKSPGRRETKSGEHLRRLWR